MLLSQIKHADRSQPHPVQGYSLRSGASVGYCSMHQQQPDRELDRERRVLYLNRNGQQKTIGAEGFERSDSIGLSYEVCEDLILLYPCNVNMLN